MTICHDIDALLDEYLDGMLPPAERSLVDAHLADCPACRSQAEALRALLAEARALPNSVMPARDLWTGIAERLGPSPEGTAGRGASAPQSRIGLGWWGRLAAAIGFILLGAALATIWQRQSAPSGFAAAQARYHAASAELSERLAQEPRALSPATMAVVERNLAIVDAAIREAERALEADPGNGALEQMLRARYEQRLELLHRATDQGRSES
jgi:anti-sigma factor RsiW